MIGGCSLQSQFCLSVNIPYSRNLLVYMHFIDYYRGMAQLVGEIACDLKLCGLIPAIYLRSNCWVPPPQSSPSHAVFPGGVQGKFGCPPKISVTPSQVVVVNHPNAVANTISHLLQKVVGEDSPMLTKLGKHTDL